MVSFVRFTRSIICRLRTHHYVFRMSHGIPNCLHFRSMQVDLFQFKRYFHNNYWEKIKTPNDLYNNLWLPPLHFEITKQVHIKSMLFYLLVMFPTPSIFFLLLSSYVSGGFFYKKILCI